MFCYSMFLFLASSCGIGMATEIDPGLRLEAKELIDQGSALLELGDLEAARSSFEVAYDIYPLAASLDGIGCVALISGKPQIAEKLFLRALDLDPNYTNAFGNLALVYEFQGHLVKAYQTYRIALKKNPKNFRIRNNFAIFIAEYKLEPKDSKGVVFNELKKAEALSQHPYILHNLSLLEKISYEQNKT